MIKIENLSFKYAKPYDNAVDCVKAEIGPGIHLLLGENGAGKTTLLRLIAGLLPPASGRCLVNGHDTSDRLPTVIRSVVFLSDDMYI
ncbi:MAG: ATP-binding cassette domain-containing protein, partial [Duncaniella sp.]|nr:ATP-binding cassette domain-containing protein [Duncaniella sp.]